MSREVLLQEVWGYNSGVTTHTLETHIYRLRQKVEKDAAAPAILVTEARRLQAGAVNIQPSWPGLSRPSTSCSVAKKDVDARHKAGHDE